MPRETTPRAGRKIYWGNPMWKVKVDANEMAEHIRKTEGNVDEHGVRTTQLYKTDKVLDDPRLAHYKNLGYDIKDEGYYYNLTMPQAEFEKREAHRIRADIDRRKQARVKDRDFNLKDEDTDLAPVSTADFIRRSDPVGVFGDDD